MNLNAENKMWMGLHCMSGRDGALLQPITNTDVPKFRRHTPVRVARGLQAGAAGRHPLPLKSILRAGAGQNPRSSSSTQLSVDQVTSTCSNRKSFEPSMTQANGNTAGNRQLVVPRLVLIGRSPHQPLPAHPRQCKRCSIVPPIVSARSWPST
jgi:hypothetical protein